MTSQDREVVILRDRKDTNDLVVAGMNRLMARLVANGEDLTKGNFAIRNFWDAKFMRDEVNIYWDKVRD
jgi:hypothetical protein